MDPIFFMLSLDLQQHLLIPGLLVLFEINDPTDAVVDIVYLPPQGVVAFEDLAFVLRAVHCER